MTLRVHHIALGARDVATLAAFYRFALGLTEAARHHRPDGSLRSVWLRLDPTGESMLMVEADEGAGASGDDAGSPRPGWFLVAFAAADAEHRAELERALERAGCPIEARSAATSYARDPEGNRIALSVYAFAASGTDT